MDLVALRIPNDWAVTYNRFYEAAPVINTESGHLENWSAFTSRLLNIHLLPRQSGTINYKYALQIEVGWYPDADPRGSYRATLVANSPADVWQEVLRYTHLNRDEIVRQIYEWMEWVNDFRWGSLKKADNEAGTFVKEFLKKLKD